MFPKRKTSIATIVHVKLKDQIQNETTTLTIIRSALWRSDACRENRHLNRDLSFYSILRVYHDFYWILQCILHDVKFMSDTYS